MLESSWFQAALFVAELLGVYIIGTQGFYHK